MVRFRNVIILILVKIIVFSYLSLYIRLPGQKSITVNPSKAEHLKNPSIEKNATKRDSHKPRRKQSHQYKGLKKILFWNDAYGDSSFNFGFGQTPFLAAGCEVDSCFTTNDRNLFDYEEIDAVVWHLRAKDKSFPPIRSVHTRYIFWMKESALYSYESLSKYQGVFNWTFTYRSDSDFYIPYGTIENLDLLDQNHRQTVQTAGTKSKLVAWFVSNCNTMSGREMLVRNLERYMRIDIYGRCGSYSCGENCHEMLERDYKFYLSFENSLCYEYITEKFFKVLKYDVVPVVYGLGYEKLNLPPHSYIDVFDFKSLEDLANYLIYLDKNDAEYNKYFRWKSQYKINHHTVSNLKAFCSLCEKLNDNGEDLQKANKVGQDTGQKTDHLGQDTGRKEYKLGQGTATRNRKLENSIKLPDRSTRKNSVESSARRKIYWDLEDWFLSNECMDPYSNRPLTMFIHGWISKEESQYETVRNEELLLPYRLRPHQEE